MAKEQPKLTKEQQVRQRLIDSIRALTNYKVYTLGQIEKTLGIPTNTLSGMLNGSRNMAPKWQTLLSEFIKALPKEDRTITIKIADIEPEPELHVPWPNLKSSAPCLPPSPVVEKPALVRTADKLPPAGMTKAQQIRWHKENNDTLR